MLFPLSSSILQRGQINICTSQSGSGLDHYIGLCRFEEVGFLTVGGVEDTEVDGDEAADGDGDEDTDADGDFFVHSDVADLATQTSFPSST